MQSIIKDSFDLKGRLAIDYGAAGVVICFDVESAEDSPRQGDDLLLIRPDGWMGRVVAGEPKIGGNHVALFVAGLTKEDIPIGSEVRWGNDFWPTQFEKRVNRSPVAHAG